MSNYDDLYLNIYDLYLNEIKIGEYKDEVINYLFITPSVYTGDYYKVEEPVGYSLKKRCKK